MPRENEPAILPAARLCRPDGLERNVVTVCRLTFATAHFEMAVSVDHGSKTTGKSSSEVSVMTRIGDARRLVLRGRLKDGIVSISTYFPFGSVLPFRPRWPQSSSEISETLKALRRMHGKVSESLRHSGPQFCSSFRDSATDIARFNALERSSKPRRDANVVKFRGDRRYRVRGVRRPHASQDEVTSSAANLAL